MLKRVAWISMLAGAALLAGAVHAQSAVDPGCPDSAASQLPELSYRCMELADRSRIWVGVANESAAGTVLLIHGLGNNAHLDWRSVVPSLSSQMRIVAVDLPGFGGSPASPNGYSFKGISSALIEVLDQLKVSRTHVVGHSLGGAVSLYFVHAHPDRVERLALVDVAGILHRAMVVRHLARIAIPKTGISMFDRLSSIVDRSINDQLTLRVLRTVDSREEFANWLADNPSIRNALFGRQTQVDAAMGLVENDFTEAIRATRVPTTIIWGRADPIAPLRTGELLAARMPDARIHIFDGIGHVPMSESATRFNALLRDSLISDLPPKFVVPSGGDERGTVECRDQKGMKFTGRIKALKIKHCSDVVVEFAQLGEVTIESSTVNIRHSTIDHAATSMIVKQSRVAATAVDIAGATAVFADNSELDFAGVTLKGSSQAADLRNGSKIYFSVSHVSSPTHTADVHGVWTTGR